MIKRSLPSPPSNVSSPKSPASTSSPSAPLSQSSPLPPNKNHSQDRPSIHLDPNCRDLVIARTAIQPLASVTVNLCTNQAIVTIGPNRRIDGEAGSKGWGNVEGPGKGSCLRRGGCGRGGRGNGWSGVSSVGVGGVRRVGGASGVGCRGQGRGTGYRWNAGKGDGVIGAGASDVAITGGIDRNSGIDGRNHGSRTGHTTHGDAIGGALPLTVPTNGPGAVPLKLTSPVAKPLTGSFENNIEGDRTGRCRVGLLLSLLDGDCWPPIIKGIGCIGARDRRIRKSIAR